MKTERALRGIALRFWLLVSLLLTVLMLAGASIEARLAYLQSVAATERLQQTEARAAADRIGQYLKAIEAQVHDVGTLAWDSGALSTADLQEEFHRVMKLVPAISEMRSVDGLGRERLYVSRVDRDRVESRTPVTFDGTRLPRSGVAYGPVTSREGARPFASLVIRERDREASGVTIAELDLKFVTDVVQRIAVGRTGNVYVVDRDNRLVAHPNPSLVLGSANLAELPHVAQARAAMIANPAGSLPTQWSRSIDGQPVLVSAAYVPGPDWLLFAEEPEEEALEPVRQILYRTGILLAAGLGVAFLASRILASALAKPILRVTEGAARIGGGRFDARIDVKTGDEVELLAREFNRMAERLEESHASLEAKVEARTRELAAARDQSERANAAKTRFLASASHDLRQPMHTIGLLVGILRDRTRNEEARSLAEKVQASVDVMQALFSSLLDISKLDAGAIKPTIVDFRIDEVLRRIDVNYAPHAAEKGLEFRIVPSRAVVHSDAILLERIVGNLVTNAIRYTARGTVLVGCRRGNGVLRILVCDTGVGIAAEHLDAVFDEFVQLANPERQRSNGLGLGLAIVKRSADLLGHPLIVRSTPDRGSTFGVEVPCVGGVAPAAGVEADASVASAAKLHGAFIVVIDDDEESRSAMSALCRHWGCHVASAGSRDDAMRALAGHLRTPDLIISDYRLRDGETGLDVIVAIRGQGEQPIPAIVVTGDVSAPELEHLRFEHVVLLHKPVDVDALRRAAEALLKALADAA